jgi:N utilization substance protein B
MSRRGLDVVFNPAMMDNTRNNLRTALISPPRTEPDYPPMSTRRRAREIVLQLLYLRDLNKDVTEDWAAGFLVARLGGRKPLIQFARQLWDMVNHHQKQIDQSLSKAATNWSVRRMAVIDRNILRLGAAEILMTDTPGQVAINEAIEIAKRYGDKNSKHFINGILDRLYNDTQSERNGAVGGESSSQSDSADLNQTVV